MKSEVSAVVDYSRPRKLRYWTPKEDDILREFYSKGKKSEVEGKLPGRTWDGIQKRAKKLNIGRGIQYRQVKPKPEKPQPEKTPPTCDSMNCGRRRFAGRASSGGEIYHCHRYDMTIGKFAKPLCLGEE